MLPQGISSIPRAKLTPALQSSGAPALAPPGLLLEWDMGSPFSSAATLDLPTALMPYTVWLLAYQEQILK